MSKQKVAIITAGGSGLGAAAAQRLANDGYNIAILSSSGKGEKLAMALGGIGFTGSNQSDEDLKQFVDQVISTWGRIDVLVNSGGHGPRGQILELSNEDWHEGMDIYLMNVIRATRLVVPIMEMQQSGSIINFSSIAALEPYQGFPASAVFRAGLAAYTKIFSDTYASHNIRMNNILCGWIDSLPTVADRLQSVPMKRYGYTQEVASVVAFLASSDAGYITGQNIRVDGGLARHI